MNSQVLHTVWCNIFGEAAGEIWHLSLLGVKGLIIKAPFTHPIFEAIFNAILRTKRALSYPARMLFRETSRGCERKLSHLVDDIPLSNVC